jgi:hypothetical protein
MTDVPERGARDSPSERYKVSYRLVMLAYRLGRRLRGQTSVADGAPLAITVEHDGGRYTSPA